MAGFAPRVHSLGELLGTLYKFLNKASLEALAERVADFASKMRKDLWFLEESYYRGRYGYVEYEREDAETCIRAAEGVLNLIEEVRSLGKS